MLCEQFLFAWRGAHKVEPILGEVEMNIGKLRNSDGGGGG